MHIELDIDDSILLSLKAPKHEFIKLLRFQTALACYRQNKLSLGKAAELAGYTRLDFIDKLRLENQPIFDYEPELIEQMEKSADALLACPKSMNRATRCK
jgi:predicted HTH domain antitoxin